MANKKALKKKSSALVLGRALCEGTPMQRSRADVSAPANEPFSGVLFVKAGEAFADYMDSQLSAGLPCLTNRDG